jgi:flagellin
MSSVSLNTNTAFILHQRALKNATQDSSDSIEKLATGKRINRAGDDAAGLSIQAKAISQIGSLRQAQKNVAASRDMLTQIDTIVTGYRDIISDIRELTIQAYNGTNSENELAAIQTQINEHVKSFVAISQSASPYFSLSNPYGTISIQYGSDDLDTRAILGVGGGLNLAPLDTFNVGSTTVAAYDGTTFGKSGNLATLNAHFASTPAFNDRYGARISRLDTQYDFNEQRIIGLESLKSHVTDTDMAEESSKLAKEQIKQRTAASVLTQANSQAGFILNLLP